MRHFVGSLCILFVFSFAVLAQEQNWSQFRGPNRDNHSPTTGIANSWSPEGPKLLWKINTLGTGYSNLCFFGNRIYTMGDFADRCFVLALDRETGEEIWRQEVGRSGGDFPGPRCTPATDGETVYAMGQHGNFVALNARDGAVRWRKDVRAEFGGNVMGPWGFAMSPLLDGDRVVTPVGGEGGALIAFNKANGNVLWRTTSLADTAGYTSAVPVTIEGVRQYLVLTNNNLAGVSPTDGSILWRANFPGSTAVCSDPVLNGDVVMASCSYNVGAFFYRITKEGNNFRASAFVEADTNLQNHHGGIVTVGDHFYLLTNRQMACVDAKTGTVVWENRSVGKGSLTYVDGKLILRSEGGDGTVAMIEATPEGYKELGRFDQPDRSDKNSWTYPTVVDKKLYLRDQNVLLVYDLN